MTGKSKKFKVTEHELVPKHEILSSEEVVKVLREYGVKPQHLPRIRASDPVARELGAKPGDIIKIERKSPTAGKAVVYRFVIAG